MTTKKQHRHSIKCDRRVGKGPHGRTMIAFIGTPALPMYNVSLGRSGGTMTTRDLVVHSDPEIMGGVPVFVGTRVPIKNLFDYLEAGDSLDQFLDSFPSVTRAQAVAALEIAREALTADAHPA